MAITAQAVRTRPRLRSRYDHIFFPGMAALILGGAFMGFAQTYYLSGVLKVPARKAGLGPPHPLIVHLHAVVMSSWIVLLLVQTSLVARHRVDLHRRLGLPGFALACLLVLAGTGVICESLARHLPAGDSRIAHGAAQVLWIVTFAVLVYFGYRKRRDPAAHKRLMLTATIILLPAALVRWPVLFAGDFARAVECCFALLLLVACYDLWSARKLYAATLWGGAAFIVTHAPVASVFTGNNVWFRVALYMQMLGRHLH